MRNRKWLIMVAVTSVVLAGAILVYTQIGDKKNQRFDPQEGNRKGWKTDTSIRSIELDEIMSGGPPKDGIPALDNPKFVTIDEASKWVGAKEPVISLEIDGTARAYPLQILIWHEIVNDRINGLPVSVTFCPLCYSAIVFDRNLDGKTRMFGVTGMLRHSDMIMFDRETESWWQQFSGEAVVGELTGKKLRRLPAQIVGFEQFAKMYPEAKVLSKDTGFKRDYGRNPYVGYDDINKRPFLFRGDTGGRLKPMEKVIAVEIGKKSKAYPYSITRKKGVINDRFEGKNIVVIHVDGAASALDKSSITESAEAGSTGVFYSKTEGRILKFEMVGNEIRDKETNSRWNVFGKAVSGPLEGKSLEALNHGDYFAFAWMVFQPGSKIYEDLASEGKKD